MQYNIAHYCKTSSCHTTNQCLTCKQKTITATAKGCNCGKKNTCPLSGKCQTEGIVYQATVMREDNMERETYVGLTENTLINTSGQHSVRWRIIKQCKNPILGILNDAICACTKKYITICHPKLRSLTKRNELAPTCRHRKLKHLSVATNPT